MLVLPDNHYLKKWFIRASVKKTSNESKDLIKIKIDECISKILTRDVITKDERARISHFLSLLDAEPPYLDYVLYRILAYAKIGNWSRSEKIILDFIEMDPLERIRLTPWRGDSSLMGTKALSLQVMNEIADVLKQKIILDSFFQTIQDFYNETDLVKEARSLQELGSRDLANKIQLKYHFGQMPKFATWMSSQYLPVSKKEKFLLEALSSNDNTTPWILLGDLPDSSLVRELIVQKMVKLKESSPHIFYHLVSSQEMIGVITRLSPGLLKNIKNTKRQFYTDAWDANPLDYWSMAHLISIGQIDENFLKKLTEL